ncbi:MAG: hypothetical protein UY85_C0009G0013 [Candidatus Peribacteria bacterium GW2011_GWB1_54_5]|nr:MAG: hypothetical protein UY85_C0009G0013 [Candidatus Peribacteria bacterium GW2011_GWB1_54_5]
MRYSFLPLAILSIVLLLIANTALAQYLPDPGGAVTDVGAGAGLSSNVCAGGGCGDDIGTVVFASMSGLRLLVDIVAVLIIIIAGFILVLSQDENQVSTAKRTLLAAVIALVLINLVEPIRNAYVQTGNLSGSAGASTLSQEILGIVDYIEEPLLVIAVLMIIISGIRAVVTFGTDQGIANIRRTIFSICAGIIIIVAKLAITRSIGSTVEDVSGISAGTNDAQGIVDTVVDVTTKVVAFMALAGVVVIVIAGIILVINKGDQEVATRSKNMILRVLLGMAVILISYGLAFVFTQVASGF